MTGVNHTRNMVSALAFMVLGSAVIFGTVVMINKLASGPDKDNIEHKTGFEIVKQEKPKPKKIVRQKQPEQKPRSKSPPNPLAGLDTSLSGIALDLPGFSMDSLNALQGDVIGDAKDIVMTGESVDQPPKPIHQGRMRYPVNAKAQGIEGYVVLSVLISANGHVEDVKVLEAHPGGVFEQAAINGVQDWQFEPAKYQGKQVRVWAKQKVRFDLS